MPSQTVDASQGWAGLFEAAFRSSRNPMVLVGEGRDVVDANGAFVRILGVRRDQLVGLPLAARVAGGPLVSDAEWSARLALGDFTGEAGLVCADGSVVGVQWAAHSEVVTGHRFVLFVALSTSLWGRRFRRELEHDVEDGTLSEREADVVRLVSLGLSGPEIAEELGIAHNTVRTHVRNAMDKLNARSRAHLVAKAMAGGHALS